MLLVGIMLLVAPDYLRYCTVAYQVTSLKNSQFSSLMGKKCVWGDQSLFIPM
jgi:hypothetical protein